MISSDQWLLDFLCDNFYWLERYLLFELRTLSFLFDLFVKGVNWILIAMLYWFVMLHYLNDFFAILLSWVDIEIYNRQFDELCSDLNLMINHTKNILDIIVDFLGIELDNILIQARLSSNKLDRARKTMTDLLKRATISYRELELAIGFLFFATKIVISERVFLRRLFDVIRRSITIIRLFIDMKVDLLWWKIFLKD